MLRFLASGVFLLPVPLHASAPLRLTPVVEGLERPVVVAHAGDGTGRLFVAEQTGRIRIVEGSELLPRPFLDLSSLVSCCNERGLLGLAFHPEYETNGWFFVNYTNRDGDTRIARYRVSSDPDVADSSSAAAILAIEQPFANHNGGQLAFGPDGMLWIGTGDGGSAGDPFDNAQSGRALLGKILRLDVDRGLPYAIPEDNPFVEDPATRDEIWAIGLRNPWRFSFDRLTGDRFIADVGQNEWEEVSFEPAGASGGRNYGWRIMEGTHCFRPGSGCDRESLILPILEYSHAEGCSVTGGYRYRGEEIPGLEGTYVFGDFCSGTIWGGLRDETTGDWTRAELLETSLLISTFGEDEEGELYVADLEGGTLYRIDGETFCSTGPSATLQVANLSPRTLGVDLELHAEGGSSGSRTATFVLPAGYVETLSLAHARGGYRLLCRFVDPASDSTVDEDSTRLVVR